MDRIAKSLRQYIEAEIIPRYDTFDKAHRRDHVETVIDQGLKLSAHYDVDPNIIYAAAAYHDTGLVEGRDVVGDRPGASHTCGELHEELCSGLMYLIHKFLELFKHLGVLP